MRDSSKMVQSCTKEAQRCNNEEITSQKLYALSLGNCYLEQIREWLQRLGCCPLPLPVTPESLERYSQTLPSFLPFTNLSLGRANKICFWIDPWVSVQPVSSLSSTSIKPFFLTRGYYFVFLFSVIKLRFSFSQESSGSENC